MKFISAQQATQETNWDAILVGSSFASQFFAYNLPKTWNILAIEKGPFVSHADQLESGQSHYLEPIQQRNKSGLEKEWVAHTMLGGNSNCWSACTPRFHPNDFRLKSQYDVGSDWPISYETLSPFYDQAEILMEINGGGSDHLLPRQTPFPHPPHAPSLSDERLRAHSRDWFAQPSARATTGSRAKCCANGVCRLCPIDSKFTITNGFDAIAHPNLKILTDTEVRALYRVGGQVRGVEISTATGLERITGRLIGLGANALFNAAILMRSGIESPALGRFIHEQVSQPVRVDIDQRNYFGGTSITGHGYPLYDGEHRSTAAAVVIENFNAPAILRPKKNNTLNRMLVKFIAEDLPLSDNRVVLEDDEPVIEWQGHSDYAYRGLERARDLLPSILPFEIEDITFGSFSKTESHIQGTHRMSVSPKDGVTDAYLRLHEHENVFALGAGSFPTSSAANPTLTLSALSLRAGAFVKGQAT